MKKLTAKGSVLRGNQQLLRRNGFRVSNTGYFVYCNGDRSAEGFDGMVRFRVKLIPYEGSDAWVEGALMDSRRCLEADRPPPASLSCLQCAYLEDIRGLGLWPAEG